LRKAGVGKATIERTVLMEFGSAASCFEALCAKELVVQGEAKLVAKLGSAFK
jgi:hypothetical protein